MSYLGQGQGVGAGGELTLAEELFVQNLGGLAYVSGDLLYFDGVNINRLGIGSSGQFLQVSSGVPSWQTVTSLGGGGTGTVTSVSIINAHGVSGTVATETTTPAITLVLGDITPSSVTSTGVIKPSANDGAALGASGTGFSDLFLASGGVINWAAGNVTLTHAANSLTFAGGDVLGLGNATATSLALSAATSLTLGSASSLAGSIVFQNATNANTLTVKSGVVSASYTLTFPTAVGGAGTVLTDAAGNGVLSWVAAGSGTVTTVSVATANGFSGTVANATTTPAITIIAGAITPNTVVASDTTTPHFDTTAGSTNTGYFLVNGKTNGSFKITTADSTAQAITLTIAAQTVGAATLTIPNMANVNKTVAWLESPSFTTPNIGAATATSVNGMTITASTGTFTLTNAKTLTVSDTTTLATNAITLGGGEVITFSATNALSLLTTGATSVTLPTSGTLVSSVTTGNGVSATNTAGALAFTLGVIAPTSVNGLTITANGTNTLNIAAGKTFVVSKSLTLAGTDSTTMTFPTTSATIARIDAANTFVGASTASAWVLTSPTITTKLNPTSDDGAPLGDTTHNWSDLFLATGAVVNYANSNVVLTHTSGVLTLGTGNLIITTAGTAAGSVATIDGTQTLTNKTVGAGSLTFAESAAIALDPSLSADGKYSGITITATAGAALAFGDVIVLDVTAGKWLKADISAAAAADGDVRGMVGMCVLAANGDASATTVLLQGIIKADANFPALTSGAPVYASTTGDITTTQPTTVDYVIRVLGFAVIDDTSATAPQSIWFNPSPDYMTHVT